jgi:hypothetical protein
MTTKTAGDRLPYLLAELKTPRVLERLQSTAETARAEGWPYEQFLETLLEAEVFARDASGARNRMRHAAFPAHKTGLLADPSAPLLETARRSRSHVISRDRTVQCDLLGARIASSGRPISAGRVEHLKDGARAAAQRCDSGLVLHAWRA